ncbi:MAG TPA: LysM domain-containing protein, partial [Pirellulales bacterium]|nr:LysM domain-containing protein [Pirellulales bacterium]
MAALLYHHVMPGETLVGIAKLHYGDAHLSQALAQRNHIRNPNQLVAGAFLQLPAGLPGVHGSPKPCEFCSLMPTGAAKVDDHKTQIIIDHALLEA